MRYANAIYLLIGVALLGVIAYETDLAEVAVWVRKIGWGMAVVLGLYFAVFLIDSFTWQMTLTSVPLGGVWLYRMWKVRLVGEAFNSVMPAAGMGGEPLKAVLLRKHYGLTYKDGAASIVLGKTVNMIALVMFAGGGFGLMLVSTPLPPSYTLFAGVGLLAFGAATLTFFSIQRLKMSSRLGSWIARRYRGRRLKGLLPHVQGAEDRIVRFYTSHKRRFAGAVLLALVAWLIGVLEVYVTLAFLGYPISLRDAWIIEAMAQLVRAGAFFIPAGLGAQEGAFLLMFAAMTGSPALGVAAAVVRRSREIVWITSGFALGSLLSVRPVRAKRPARVRTDPTADC